MSASPRLLADSPGGGSALTEHATTEWLESTGGNEKLVAIQLEPRRPLMANKRGGYRGVGMEKQRGEGGDLWKKKGKIYVRLK